MTVDLVEETADHCIYEFGSPDTVIGRVRLEKPSGDVVMIDWSETEEAPSEQFYIAHLVPRLQTYHERSTYPRNDQWEA